MSQLDEMVTEGVGPEDPGGTAWQLHGVDGLTLQRWRAAGWLGDGGWDDPDVDAQIRWLGQIDELKGADCHDAAAGPGLRASGCVYAYRVAGCTEWVPVAGADGPERLVAGLAGMPLVSVAPVPSAGFPALDSALRGPGA